MLLHKGAHEFIVEPDVNHCKRLRQQKMRKNEC